MNVEDEAIHRCLFYELSWSHGLQTKPEKRGFVLESSNNNRMCKLRSLVLQRWIDLGELWFPWKRLGCVLSVHGFPSMPGGQKTIYNRNFFISSAVALCTWSEDSFIYLKG